MSNLVKKIRAFLCCGEEDRGPQTIVSYTLLLKSTYLTDAFTKQSAPTNFQKLEVELPGLSEHELVLPVLTSKRRLTC